jgi:hypothetical protein
MIILSRDIVCVSTAEMYILDSGNSRIRRVLNGGKTPTQNLPNLLVATTYYTWVDENYIAISYRPSDSTIFLATSVQIQTLSSTLGITEIISIF